MDPQAPTDSRHFACPRSLAVRSRYAHHAEHSGYRQILRYTRPVAEIGIDERGPAPPNRLLKRYPWLYELIAWQSARKNQVDVVHILYAEEYYRFLAFLLPDVPIVLTFHQPADILERELTRGDPMGRVGAITHRLSQSRFRRAAAAIITSETQFEPLAKVMPPDLIHYIPLGASIAELVAIARGFPEPSDRKTILTVGNWRRDWRFYFDFVRRCLAEAPNWQFTLVNRRLPAEWAATAAGLPNLTFTPSVSDEELYRLYHSAAVQFLPFEAAAGNNSVNEGLAFGCPVVTNVSLGLEQQGDFFRMTPLAFDHCRDSIAAYMAIYDSRRSEIRRSAQAAVSQRDWSNVAARTIDIYRSVV